MRQLFDLLDNRWARRWLAGVREPWVEASPAALARFLANWRDSAFPLLRSAYQALHALINAGWYGNAASWSAAGRPTLTVAAAIATFWHNPERRDRAARALARLVRPGGSIVVSTLNRTLRSLAIAKIGAEYIARLLPAGTPSPRYSSSIRRPRSTARLTATRASRAARWTSVLMNINGFL